MDAGQVMERLGHGNSEKSYRMDLLEIVAKLMIADARGGQVVARDLTTDDITRYVNVGANLMHEVAKRDAFS